MSKKSCEAAESIEDAVLRMARVNCKQHERTLEKMHILLYDGTGTRQTRINAGKTAVVPGWKEQKESRQNEGIRSTRRKLC